MQRLIARWPGHRDSNPDRSLRRGQFYPVELWPGDVRCRSAKSRREGPASTDGTTPPVRKNGKSSTDDFITAPADLRRYERRLCARCASKLSNLWAGEFQHQLGFATRELHANARHIADTRHRKNAPGTERFVLDAVARRKTRSGGAEIAALQRRDAFKRPASLFERSAPGKARAPETGPVAAAARSGARGPAKGRAGHVRRKGRTCLRRERRASSPCSPRYRSPRTPPRRLCSTA